ncbi:MAG TPA: RluA family pseudouridine synthase [Balneolales bacterium]|nr:RluA family pseudouridine synthase [Balneolales bacterium]
MHPDITIIFEDNHLLVVNKPPNVPTQPDRSGDPDMLSMLKTYLKEKYHKPGNVFLGLVHRLDRPTSGLIVFARTSKAAARLSDQMRRKKIQKDYMAVIHGVLDKNGLLEHHLAKDRDTNIVSVVSGDHQEAKRATLTYETMENNGDLTLVEIHLLTGRSHQIRVQFAEEGHPVWGDHKYGIADRVNENNLALHAFRLQLIHPTQKNEMTFLSYPEINGPWNKFSKLSEMIRSSGSSMSTDETDPEP